MVWQGGMSFHGGLIGVILAMIWFSRKHHVPLLAVTDLLAPVAPIGLFFGRIANFINGELFGRVTDSPLGMIFPYGGVHPRHPSQLYEAGLEGVLLFLVLIAMAFFTRTLQWRGRLSGYFLMGYGIARSISELFREPDDFLGFFPGGVTMGQLLCVPMIAAGIYLVVRSRVHRA